ncbi:hypothetical protein HPP92_015389 [Vanilla planifolia]|uniref:Alpha 1,4-glycosyltransferase domain-containing protein n=1 Tax=Vanilla planifolia TaxID=51239 RepID=A0A835UVR7_VANPL|nr:hypothetical protein HPP92_015389 [Vanilla planifolia]
MVKTIKTLFLGKALTKPHVGVMHRQPSCRRRSSYTQQLCVAGAAVLLVLSLSILHIRLSSSSLSLSFPFRASSDHSADSNSNPLFDDADNDAFDGSADDRIDELDFLDEDKRLVTTADDADADDPDRGSGSGLFWDHALGVARVSFGRSDSGSNAEEEALPEDQERGKIAFGSDDEPVNEGVRDMLASIQRIEDVLLLKVGGHGGESRLRERWAKWLEGKGDFLRRDWMLRSNLELLNPKNHPLLQDPDLTGVAGFTRGDRMMQKSILKEMDETNFMGLRNKRMDGRRTLDLKVEEKKKKEKGQEDYEHARRWGYFPGIDSRLGFSDFVDQFLGRGQCSIRVFMVWNSPSWSFGIRQQRGIESLLHHHRDACVLVLSEMMELDFFNDFVKDGFKVAVVIPNLDELLKDSPVQIFASVWFEWRKTKYYPIHYSELVRLAVLYKYGGLYLDSDLIVLKPLDSLKNAVGIEDQQDGNSSFNGAVMAFDSHSVFLLECLTEFYSTYDDTRLRWNGADLLTRVIKRLQDRNDKSLEKLMIIPSTSIFPIGSTEILRYFVAASNQFEKSQQQTLLARILNESFTVHLWNGETSALVPEPDSLVDRLVNQYCFRCHDVL